MFDLFYKGQSGARITSDRKWQRLDIKDDGTRATLALNDMEIWDGADLALIREVLGEMIDKKSYRVIEVNLEGVKYIPSGFFGMLYEWHEYGVQIFLSNPQPNVEHMLWFRMFFVRQGDGSYLFNDEEVRHNTPGQRVEYHKREVTGELDDDEATHGNRLRSPILDRLSEDEYVRKLAAAKKSAAIHRRNNKNGG